MIKCGLPNFTKWVINLISDEDGSSLVERDALECFAAVAAGVLHRGARRLRPGVDQQVPPQVVLAGEESLGIFNP